MAASAVAKKPVVVGICGDACSGKSGFAAGLAAVFGLQRATVVALDDYRRFTRLERHEARYSRIHPDVYFLDIMAQHAKLLADGQPVLRPAYNRSTGLFDRPLYVERSEIVIAEGLQAFATAELRDALDLKIFLEPTEAIRRQWKLDRDVAVRRRGEGDVRTELDQWRDDSESFIGPQRKWADMIVQFVPGSLAADSVPSLEKISLLLRPSLPMPGVAEPLLKLQEGIQLNHEDDMGISVSRVDIPAFGLDRRFVEVEQSLWEKITQKRDSFSAEGVGQVIGPAGDAQTVPALVVAQLAAALQVVAAGAGQ